MIEKATLAQPNIINAILLDDELDARTLATEIFNQNGVNLITTKSIEDFLVRCVDYPVILSDFRLIEISPDNNGVDVLLLAREKAPNAILAIYTSFDDKITDHQRALLEGNNISILLKSDPTVAVKNIKLKYKSIIPQLEKAEQSMVNTQNSHYQLNKQITLMHLENLSNKDIRLPIVSLNKSYKYEDLVMLIERDTDIGSAFILEFVQTIALLDKY